jgi:phosphate-selective porin OprO/OprP
MQPRFFMADFRLRFALSGFLLLGLGPFAVADEPPTTPAPDVPTVEERLQKLEEMNEKLLRQNQELSRQLNAVTETLKISAPAPAKPDAPAASVKPVVMDANTIKAQISTGAAVGGGDLLSPPEGGPADRSAGPDANTVDRLPSRGSAEGGGDLISFAPDDPKDARGIPMIGRFGRRFTNNGLWFESPDKVFQVHIGGRAQMDSAFFSTSNRVQFGPRGIGPLRDGVDIRRMRVRLEGALYENMLYVTEFDFINGTIPQGRANAGPLTSQYNTPGAATPVPLDLWVTFRNIPYIGHIRIGNQKEPMGFERLVSSRFLNFMERSFNQDAFYAPYDNGFVPGISTFSTYADRMGTYAVGIFKNVSNGYGYDVGGGNFKVTGRLTRLLLDEDDGRRLMHLGISGRQSSYDNGFQRFRARGPERAGLGNLWPLYANTGVFAGSGGQQALNLESVNVFGPWTINAEYLFHWSQNAVLPGNKHVGTIYNSGGYVEVLYFLTGEHRAYIRESALFDRVVPIQNAYWVKGKNGRPNASGHGAWQVGMRYNYLDLNDKNIQGGILNDLTFGLNWFINPNMKFQWNYSLTDRQSPGGLSSGLIQGFGMRYAMDY